MDDDTATALASTWKTAKELELEDAIEEFKKTHRRLPSLEEESEMWLEINQEELH